MAGDPGMQAAVGVVVREATLDDRPAILELNQAALPAVSPLDGGALDQLIERCQRATVAAVDDEVVGMVITYAPGADYDSENYRWFSAWSDDFSYVDRIVVAPEQGGRGIGRLLYADVIARARAAGVARVTCEVNERPRNQRSLDFHDRLGFEPVGRQETGGGEKAVVMLSLELDDLR